MLEIKLADTNDCTAMIAVRQAAWAQERVTLPWAVVQHSEANYTREYAIRANWQHYAVLKVDDVLLGMIRWQGQQVLDWAVQPEQQRRGYGSQLLRFAEAQLVANGTVAQCIIPEANVLAAAGLRANGYKPINQFYQPDNGLACCLWQKALHTLPAAPAALGLDFAHYQQESHRTWQYVPTHHPVIYPTLGLLNEAGELAGKIKKLFRDKHGVIDEIDRAAIQGELGDVLWYLAQICTVLELDFAAVASGNLEKLFSRLARNQIQGSGDNR